MSTIYIESSGMYIEERAFDLFNKDNENRSFRKPGWVVKNFSQDAPALMKRPACDLDAGEYDKLHPWLLSLAKNAKDMDRINYLRADANTAKQQLRKLSKNVEDVQKGTPSRYVSVKAIQKKIDKGLTTKKINDHIKWLDTVYRKALNDRAKEIREKQKAKNESGIFTGLEYEFI